MSNDLQASTAADRPRLGRAGTLVRLALIGVALAAVAGPFAYVGGWFTPNDLTPARFTDGFEQVDGVHPGYRRNHARGMGASGYFDSNGNGVRLSKAVVFRSGRVPVIGRFSLGGGRPDVADSPDAVRGLGLQFILPDGEEWRTAMINLPVFPFRSPEAFYENLIASKPDPKTGKPDPARRQAFLDSHPETVKALGVIKGGAIPSGFESTTFHALNAFRFIDSAGASIPVRWVLTPNQPFEATSTASAVRDRNYLFDALSAAVRRRPLSWHLVVIVGKPGDPTNDATIGWPEDREKVDVGTLTIDGVQSDDDSPATKLNFDPLVLPAGIAPSDDPLLSARSAVYSQSFTRREGETKQPSAIPPAAAHKGD